MPYSVGTYSSDSVAVKATGVRSGAIALGNHSMYPARSRARSCYQDSE